MLAMARLEDPKSRSKIPALVQIGHTLAEAVMGAVADAPEPLEHEKSRRRVSPETEACKSPTAALSAYQGQSQNLSRLSLGYPGFKANRINIYF